MVFRDGSSRDQYKYGLNLRLNNVSGWFSCKKPRPFKDFQSLQKLSQNMGIQSFWIKHKNSEVHKEVSQSLVARHEFVIWAGQSSVTRSLSGLLFFLLLLWHAVCRQVSSFFEASTILVCFPAGITESWSAGEKYKCLGWFAEHYFSLCQNWIKKQWIKQNSTKLNYKQGQQLDCTSEKLSQGHQWAFM